jgi:GNAT superfamily N-acetyltransferase
MRLMVGRRCFFLFVLPIMGIEPSKQGKGFGSALLQHAIIQCNRENKLAYRIFKPEEYHLLRKT